MVRGEVKERKISLGSTKPLLINASRPATTKHGMSGRQKVQLHFTRAGDYPSYNASPKTTVRLVASTKKGFHQHSLTQPLPPSSTRAQTASTRASGGGSLFDAFMNSSPGQGEPVSHYPGSLGGIPLKYGNLLKLNTISPDEMGGEMSRSEKWKREKQKERMERRTLKMGTPKYGSA